MAKPNSSVERFLTALLFTAALVAFDSAALAQSVSIPPMTGAEVSASVTRMPSGALRYSYSVDNSAGSLPIDAVQFSIAIGNGRPTPSENLDNGADALGASQLLFEDSRLVGVGIASSPPSWVGSRTSDRLLAFQGDRPGRDHHAVRGRTDVGRP